MQVCNLTVTTPGDFIDNDCDSLIDEELDDGIGRYYSLYTVLRSG